jgi:hypothetical protein
MEQKDQLLEASNIVQQTLAEGSENDLRILNNYKD